MVVQVAEKSFDKICKAWDVSPSESLSALMTATDHLAVQSSSCQAHCDALTFLREFSRVNALMQSPDDFHPFEYQKLEPRTAAQYFSVMCGEIPKLLLSRGADVGAAIVLHKTKIKVDESELLAAAFKDIAEPLETTRKSLASIHPDEFQLVDIIGASTAQTDAYLAATVGDGV